VSGVITLPITVDDTTHELDFLIISNLTPDIILGVDFWLKFDIAPFLFKNLTLNSKTFQSSHQISALTSSEFLGDDEQRILHEIIKDFEDVSFEKRGLGRTTLVAHKIETTGPPIKQRYYPLSPIRQAQLEAELDEMLTLDVVEPSKSSWSNPVLMVIKKDNSIRFCLDSRKLNSVTIRDSYPLPHIQSILQTLNGAKFISSIDLSKAFWQIPLEETSKEKTAFVVPQRGLYQFKVLPFGLKNSSAEQQRLSDRLFGPKFDRNVHIFVDDLLIISSDFTSHMSLLTKVVQTLREANLTINLGKSAFCRKELKYLGYVVDAQGLRTDPEKIEAIKNFPRPTNATSIRKFIGVCSYYKRFINDYSNLSAPLTKLTGSIKGVSKFAWSDEAENAFQKLKDALISAPVLRNPDFALPFNLHTDASDIAIGSFLGQEVEDGEYAVAYYSRTLSKAERNYSVSERELLAVLESVRHFRSYIEGGEFTVYTDHASLKWMMSLENPSGRLARWSTELLQYSFKIVHRKGKHNSVPDALSRVEISALTQANMIQDEWYLNLLKNVQEKPQSFPNYAFLNDQLYRYKKPSDSLHDENAWKLVVAEEDRLRIIQENHCSPENAHMGIFKTSRKIQLYYYWPKLFSDVKKFINSCETCKAYKTYQGAPLGLMTNPKKINRPMQCLSIDLQGPFPRSKAGNIYILSVLDTFTKYLWLFPLKKSSTENIIKHLENDIFLVSGVCSTILVDNGTQFTSRKFKQLMWKYNVPNLFYTPVYTPQSNTVERYHKTIVTAIGLLVDKDHRNWCTTLPHVKAAMNGMVNLSTLYTPNFLFYGREVILDGNLHTRYHSDPLNLNDLTLDSSTDYVTKLSDLSDIYDQVQLNLFEAHKRNANHYNLRRKTVVYKPNDIVWKTNFINSKGCDFFSSKLAPRFLKCKVVKVISPLIYNLQDEFGKNIGNHHIQHLLKQ
jgi:hypothetical protein